ncbi:uncharacterized protein [Miscanthus floridulus]|uniref:uncharacterized protein n=1 Tax=Miscanthus floridulus TaxID=154761 RepID=UPI003457FA88
MCADLATTARPQPPAPLGAAPAPTRASTSPSSTSTAFPPQPCDLTDALQLSAAVAHEVTAWTPHPPAVPVPSSSLAAGAPAASASRLLWPPLHHPAPVRPGGPSDGAAMSPQAAKEVAGSRPDSPHVGRSTTVGDGESTSPQQPLPSQPLTSPTVGETSLKAFPLSATSGILVTKASVPSSSQRPPPASGIDILVHPSAPSSSSSSLSAQASPFGGAFQVSLMGGGGP